ncbi:HNH endonuclease [Rossellomorea vietnamensis]|uniref:HNH endonuclease n=1 Tax=Rossellomorea vietnamensis TaxID=218284 RepID=A0ACD4C9Z8_9BACI|nr:HNH endonuclease [Rossellomorea vietnamensis]UXH44427.1 HNH endonuclease [Rossellomorea vietnamensis]
MNFNKEEQIKKPNTVKKRNPKWERDELILALELYFRHNPNTISAKHQEVLKLSKILNSLPIHGISPEYVNFRNPNGVYMKMSNFLRLDPNYKGKGLERGSKLEEDVWNEFYSNKSKLRDLATNIKASVESKKEEIKFPINEEEEEVFPEGKILFRVHKLRERNVGAVKKKKQQALENNELYCEICQFDFFKTYGEIGKGFIECHHTIPVSEYTEKNNTRLQDLILVCSNCHRMLHRRRPWLNKGDLMKLMEKSSK